MTIEAIDWDKVQSIIDSMKNQFDDNDPQQTLSNRIKAHISQYEELIDEGWPYQEIAHDNNRSSDPVGIPVDLACIVLSVFEFCAYANIDLAYAMEQIKNV